MKIEYDKVGDYYVPRIALRKRKYEERILSRYGRAYLRYLKENKKGLYTELLLDDRLIDYLMKYMNKIYEHKIWRKVL